MNIQATNKSYPQLIKHTLFLFLFNAVINIANAQQMGGEKQQIDFTQQSKVTAIEFATALNNHDVDTLSAMTDSKSLGRIIATALFDKPSDIDDFVLGFSAPNTRKTLVNNVFAQFFREESNTNYIRMLDEQGMMRPLVRIDYATGGHEYLILFLNKQQQMYDFHLASKGAQFSDSLTQATSLMVSTDDSFFGKMFGNATINKNVMNKFQQLGKLRNAGEFEQAYRVLQSMPEDMKRQRVMIDTGISLAQNINDEEYLLQLSLLDKHFGDLPSTQFMLLDYYVMTQNDVKTKQAMANVVKRFGMDGALGELSANLYYNSGDLSEALEFSYQGINTEPSYEPPYWTVLTIYNEQANYQGVADTLNLITERLYYEFTPEGLSTESAFAGFLASAEYQIWLQNKG